MILLECALTYNWTGNDRGAREIELVVYMLVPLQ